jgi:Fe-S cluster assembly protein SufB
MSEDIEIKDQAAREAAARVADYEHGWSSDIEQEYGPKGLSEDTVRYISAKKDEPEWMLEWRLKAYRHWLTMPTPDWAKLQIPPIDYQAAYYWAAPKAKPKLGSLDEVDPRSCASTKSSAFRWRSRRCSRASRARARLRSMRCSTAFR